MAYQSQLIVETKSLQKAITGFANMGQRYNDRAHLLAVSVLSHVATHGQVDVKEKTDPLNRFFAALSPAFQSAFKVYVNKHCTEPVKLDDGSTVRRGFLDFKKQTWLVVNKETYDGAVRLREAFKAIVPKLEQAEKGSGYEPFYSLRPENEERAFEDANILKQLDALLKRAQKAHDESGTVSDEALAALTRADLIVKKAVNPEGKKALVGNAPDRPAERQSAAAADAEHKATSAPRRPVAPRSRVHNPVKPEAKPEVKPEGKPVAAKEQVA